MNWIALIGAGLCEVAFTFCMGRLKGVSGWEFYSWLLGFLCCMSLSMYLLIKAIQTIPIGTAYPIWTGIGAAGTVLLGILFFHEPATFWRLFFISTLVISVVGLKWYEGLETGRRTAVLKSAPATRLSQARLQIFPEYAQGRYTYSSVAAAARRRRFGFSSTALLSISTPANSGSIMIRPQYSHTIIFLRMRISN